MTHPPEFESVPDRLRRLLLQGAVGLGLLPTWRTLSAQSAPWQAFVAPFNHVYPALLLAASRSDGSGIAQASDGLFGLRLKRDQARRIKIALRAPALHLDQNFQLELSPEQTLVLPEIHWNRRALGQIQTPQTGQVEFRVRRDDHDWEVQSVSVQIRPAHEVLYFVHPGASSTPTDLNWLFAAFVDERHPVIRDVVSAATRRARDTRLDGYRTDDAMHIHQQVLALWNELRRRGFTYAPLPKRQREHPALFSQSIRPLALSWRDGLANCADGSVLIASSLRAIGLHARLVLVPGHMFVAYALDGAGSQFAYLETTMLGERINAKHTDGLDPEEIAFMHFYAAVQEGTRRYRLAKNKFRKPDNPAYQMIDIDAARRNGVQSIVRDLEG